MPNHGESFSKEPPKIRRVKNERLEKERKKERK
jgi:hypothetical protein